MSIYWVLLGYAQSTFLSTFNVDYQQDTVITPIFTPTYFLSGYFFILYDKMSKIGTNLKTWGLRKNF